MFGLKCSEVSSEPCTACSRRRNSHSGFVLQLLYHHALCSVSCCETCCRVFVKVLLQQDTREGCSGAELRCRATSGRTIFHPLGHVGYGFVRTGNVLAHRTILLLLLLSAKKVRWLLEQPSNSCFADLPRWRWFLSLVTVA